MVRSLHDTYENSVSKLALDRDLSAFLARQSNPVIRDTSWRIARCADDHNLWFVNAPESGWLHGRFWKCRSRLCSFCLSAESRRRRKTLRQTLQNYSAATRASEWRFLTLTIENPHLSIAETRRTVQLAWSKLRKRACFAVVVAGAKSEEFTLTKAGYHYHIHSLLHTPKRPDYQLFRRSWTECVESSGGASQRLFGYDTIDGYLIAQFKRISSPSAITNELCKYITKSTSFQQLSVAAILELAETKRWHRMFEVFGALRGNLERPSSVRNGLRPIVHTKNLSDGQHSERWWFEKKRADSRYFMIDALEKSIGATVFTLAEMRAIIADL
jgi:hypothetical protein